MGGHACLLFLGLVGPFDGCFVMLHIYPFLTFKNVDAFFLEEYCMQERID